MVMGAEEAIEQVRMLLDWRDGEAERLDRLHAYLTGRNDVSRWLNPNAKPEVRRLAQMSKVNVLAFVIDAAAQGLFVDGFRGHSSDPDDAGEAAEDDVTPIVAADEEVWRVWQANAMDARQGGIHRAAMGYGTAYATVLPGTDRTGNRIPRIRGFSPRSLTALYGEDDLWPEYALWGTESNGKAVLWRLVDDEAVYFVGQENRDDRTSLRFIEARPHGAPVCPVVRFRPTADLDHPERSDIEDLLPLQDQLDATTFTLLVGQHYQSFRQRYVVGWTAESEREAAKASAASLMNFEDHPDDVRVGEFAQIDTRPMVESREATLRIVATTSQTPVHELLGAMNNLSAEALVAARDSHSRKLGERKVSFGEAHEQMLRLAGRLAGIKVDDAAQVRWRDLEPRSLSQTADALGKLAQMLGVPAEALWHRIPGVTQQELADMRAAAAEEGDALADLTGLLNRQAA